MGTTPRSWGTGAQAPGSLVWLLMPHLGLALVILSLLFADFLMYRRRVHVLQKRAFDKQELMDTFPKRVIAGLYRVVVVLISGSDAVGALHVDHEDSVSADGRPISVFNRNIPSSVSATPLHVATPKNALGTHTADTSSDGFVPSKSPEPSGASAQKKISKKKLKILENLKSSTVNSAVSLDVPEAAGKPAVNGVSSASRRRLEKHDSCRKLPPLPDSSSPNGFVQNDRRLSPLLDESEGEDLSMA
ncbi:hypothetical protein ACOMHN_049678 [Nucella lapillus]